MRHFALLLCLITIPLVTGCSRAGAKSEPAFHRQLLQAVTDHRIIRFTYAEEILEAEPHAYGLSRDDHPLLRAYVPRPSRAGNDQPAWLLFRTDRLTDLEVTSLRFDSPRTGYRPGDKMMKVIYAEYHDTADHE